jgi:hypothetical protein
MLPPGHRSTVAFAGGLDDQITILAGLLAESGSVAAAGERRTLRERAISLHCEMVGALVLSRSVAQAAPALSNEILENVQRDITASLDLLSSRTSRISTDLSGVHLFLSRSEQSIEGVAISIEVILRKPSVRNAGRAEEPASPAAPMADQHGVESVALDQAYGGCRLARLEGR